jgi:maleylacetoacetate isomerase
LNGRLTLYSYWRSSAAYRVRIALNLKQLDYEIAPVDLPADGQHADEFHAVNPQELIPVLRDGQRLVRQSMAIMEYLDETYPQRPLLPATSRDRARIRSIAQAIACDIHPLNNLRVMQYFEREWQIAQDQREAWMRHWIELGFGAVEAMLSDNPAVGEFCEGENAGFADCLLVPQLYNARRFGVDVSKYPSIVRIEAACAALPEFEAARPENQPDAPKK